MALAHFRILIHDFLNKDPDIVPEEAHLNILDSRSAACIVINGNETKHKMHISRRVHSVKNGKK